MTRAGPGALVLVLAAAFFGVPDLSTHREVTAQVEIQASPARVWSVLTDLAAYPIWKPCIYPATGEIAPGARLQLTLHSGNAAITYDPVVETVLAPRELSWAWGDGGVRADARVYDHGARTATRAADGERALQGAAASRCAGIAAERRAGARHDEQGPSDPRGTARLARDRARLPVGGAVRRPAGRSEYDPGLIDGRGARRISPNRERTRLPSQTPWTGREGRSCSL